MQARTVEEWEAEVGRQVRELRIQARHTQEELARAANVSVSALHNLEHGRGSSLSTVVAVVRALGRREWLEALAPPVTVSPLAMLEAARGRPQPSRVRHRRPAPGGST